MQSRATEARVVLGEYAARVALEEPHVEVVVRGGGAAVRHRPVQPAAEDAGSTLSRVEPLAPPSIVAPTGSAARGTRSRPPFRRPPPRSQWLGTATACRRPCARPPCPRSS